MPLSVLLVLHMISLLGHMPPPDQLPREHTGWPLMQGQTSFSFSPPAQHFTPRLAHR